MRNKITFAIAGTLIASSTYVSADTNAEIMALRQRIKTLEQRKESNNRVTPAARPDVKDGADLFFTAEALLWKAEEDGLEFAELGYIDVNKSFPSGSVLNPDFDWKWGFRVGVGYNTPQDGWDIYLNWVRFNSRDHQHVNVNPFTAVPASIISASTGSNIPSGPTSFSNLQEASTHWNLNLNILDIELGREFFVSKWLTLRPFAGLRTAWIDQKYNNDYIFGNSLGIPTNTFTTDQRCRFWGLGIRGGLNTLWSLGHGWGIYANAAISLLPGRFHVTFEQDNLTFPSVFVPTGSLTEHDTHDHLNVARAITDVALGLCWETLFNDDALLFGVNIGVEQHYFFGQNQFRNYAYDNFLRPVSKASIGDLSTHGFTAGVQFGF